MEMPSAKSSGEISSSGLIESGRNLLHAVLVSSPGDSSGGVSVYDGEDNTGTLLAIVKVSTSNRFRDVEFGRPVRAKNGLYVEIEGSPDSVVIHYG